MKIMRDLPSGREWLYDMPVANVSPTGAHALSINFDRIYDVRPGYGYCRRRDPWAGEKAPADDGVWLIDLADGKARQGWLSPTRRCWSYWAPRRKTRPPSCW